MQYCKHCDPYVRDRRHVIETIDMVLAPYAKVLSAFEGYLRRLFWIRDSIFLKALLAAGVLREVTAQDDDISLYNRSLVVVREARKRGISINAVTFLGRGIDVYALSLQGSKIFFRALPHLVVDGLSPELLDNKAALKSALREMNLPNPKGKLCRRYTEALRFVNADVGFPVVVKPDAESLSLHVTSNIKNEAELKDAIAIAKQISRRFIVEKHVDGDVFRITVLEGSVIAACRREPPYVIGDGARSVRELIAQKNNDPRRGRIDQKNHTLHKIVMSSRGMDVLAAQGADLGSIPARDKKLHVHDKLVLGCGADIVDVTDDVHEDNVKLFSTVAVLCRMPLVGIDFIARDIARPHYEQTCGVIEINSVPYIDMHHNPTAGVSRDVARRLLDYCLSRPTQ